MTPVLEMRRLEEVAFCQGDLLLWRAGRWSLMNLVIGRAGRSGYVHASTVAIEHGEARCIDTIQFRGGRNVCLRDQVELSKNSGRIDVYRPRADLADALTNGGLLGNVYKASMVVEKMLDIVGKPYGWRAIFLVSLLHLPVIRLFVAPATDDADKSPYPPFCSEARAIADRFAGFDPVQNLADRITEPGDLGRSLFYEYLFTLE